MSLSLILPSLALLSLLPPPSLARRVRLASLALPASLKTAMLTLQIPVSLKETRTLSARRKKKKTGKKNKTGKSSSGMTVREKALKRMMLQRMLRRMRQEVVRLKTVRRARWREAMTKEHNNDLEEVRSVEVVKETQDDQHMSFSSLIQFQEEEDSMVSLVKEMRETQGMLRRGLHDIMEHDSEWV